MSRAYIKGGTPVGSESLCTSCANAHIMTGYRESEMVTVCTNVGPERRRCRSRSTTAPATTTRTVRPGSRCEAGDRCRHHPLKPVGFKVGAGFMPTVKTKSQNVDLENVRGRLL